MCTPAIIIPALLTVASTAVGMVTQKSQANSQAQVIQQNAQNNANLANYNAQVIENTSQYNAQVSETNAKVMDDAAADSIIRGSEEAARQRLEARRSAARGRAAMASSGLLTDYGTNLDLLKDNAATGEMNALTVMTNAQREAQGYKNKAIDYRAEGTGLLYEGKMQADSERYAGQVGLANANYESKVVKKGGTLAAASTLVTGASSLGKYKW